MYRQAQFAAFDRASMSACAILSHVHVSSLAGGGVEAYVCSASLGKCVNVPLAWQLHGGIEIDVYARMTLHLPKLHVVQHLRCFVSWLLFWRCLCGFTEGHPVRIG